MPSFADLKAKAVNAKDASVSKMQSVRDKNSSVPMKKTNWNPYSGEAAPPPPPPRVNPNSRPQPAFLPPPSRTNSPSGASVSSTSSPAPSAAPRPPPRSFSSSSSSLSSGGPPPINRATMPSKSFGGPPPLSHSTRPDPAPSIDWTNLSAQDKEVFFSWLDEFFTKFLNIDIPSRGE